KLNSALVTDDQGGQAPLLNATARKATATLVQTLHASMQTAARIEATPTSPAHLVHFHRLNDHRVARYQEEGAPLVLAAPSTLPIWFLDFTADLPAFTALNDEQADQARAAQM